MHSSRALAKVCFHLWLRGYFLNCLSAWGDVSFIPTSLSFSASSCSEVKIQACGWLLGLDLQAAISLNLPWLQCQGVHTSDKDLIYTLLPKIQVVGKANQGRINTQTRKFPCVEPELQTVVVHSFDHFLLSKTMQKSFADICLHAPHHWNYLLPLLKQDYLISHCSSCSFIPWHPSLLPGFYHGPVHF